MRKLLRIFEVTTLFMSILSCFVFAEDITITTYYPSPFGSYNDLQVTNKATFGPFSMFATAAVAPGSIVLSGNTAGVYIVDRNLAAYPAIPGAGDAYAMYNQGGTWTLRTSPFTVDMLTVSSNGITNFNSSYDNTDITPGVTFNDINGYGTVTMGAVIYCND